MKIKGNCVIFDVLFPLPQMVTVQDYGLSSSIQLSSLHFNLISQIKNLFYQKKSDGES